MRRLLNKIRFSQRTGRATGVALSATGLFSLAKIKETLESEKEKFDQKLSESRESLNHQMASTIFYESISKIIENYQNDLKYFQDFPNIMNKFIDGWDEKSPESYINLSLNLAILALSEQVYGHKNEFSEPGETIIEPKFLSKSSKMMDFSAAGYSSKSSQIQAEIGSENKLIFSTVDSDRHNFDNKYFSFDQVDLSTSWTSKNPNNAITKPEFFLTYNESEGELVVTIRGTKSLQDVITDIMVGTVNLKIPEIDQELAFHEGMFKSSSFVLDKVRPMIEEFIRNQQNDSGEEKKIKRIVFTGHSLGGGCAQICGLLYRQYIFNSETFDLVKIVGAVRESVEEAGSSLQSVGLMDTLKKASEKVAETIPSKFSERGGNNNIYKNVKIDVFAYAAPPVLGKSVPVEVSRSCEKKKKSKEEDEPLKSSYLENILQETINNINKAGVVSFLNPNQEDVHKNKKNDYIDFSKIRNFNVYNFQLERDLVCYLSVGNYIRFMLAMRKISDLNWTRLHKIRYILGMRRIAEGNDGGIFDGLESLLEREFGNREEEIANALNNEKSAVVKEKEEINNSEAMTLKTNLTMDYPDLSQEKVNLSNLQNSQLLQHIYIAKDTLSNNSKTPYYFRLRPFENVKYSPYTEPPVAEKYKCVKIEGDVGCEVLPIGWHNSAAGHVKTHGKWRYQDAFSKLYI